MSELKHQIAAAQRRLWANRLLSCLTTVAAAGILIFAMLWILQRLFDYTWPLSWIAMGIAGLGIAISIGWTVLTRENQFVAAAELDQVAGLRERVSTSLHCNGVEDPFAQAVVADAQRAVAGLRAHRLIRFTAPPRWGWAVMSLVLLAAPLLIPSGILKPAEVKAGEERKAALETTKVAVKHQMDQLKELTAKTPGLEDLKTNDDELDLGPAVKEQSPSEIRHEALKKIDRYEDAIRQKKNSDRYDSLNDMKKMMRAVNPPESNEAATQKLAQALQQGDFKTAKEEVEKLKEQLATLKSEEDKEMVQKIGKQLEELSKQLERIASDEKLLKELEKAGIKQEDVERMLERLSKKDLEQLQKKLEESGMTKEQAEKLAKQLQQKQGAKSLANKLAQNMKGSASSAQAGEAENASEKLSQAGEQLSELEQLEQEMAQLDAAASATAQAKNEIQQRCPS